MNQEAIKTNEEVSPANREGSPTEEIAGFCKRVLEIDLGARTFTSVPIDEEQLFLWLGGKGLALKLVYDRIKPGVEALGPDNVIAFATGPYQGTGAPCSSRFCAVAKSPLTGIMTHSSCGGPFGLALKTSGWDGLIILGASAEPVNLLIDSQGVVFQDASSLWGKNTRETLKLLGSGASGAITIGPAGENLVPYANLCSGRRYLGRGGLGAVMGAKKVKAVVAKGKQFKIVARDRQAFHDLSKKANGYINSNHFTSGPYRDFGTSGSMDIYNSFGMIPVRNFTGGSHPEATKLSGQHMHKVFNPKFKGCNPCSIRCGHVGSVDGKERVVPEYETVGLLGSNLLIFDPVVVSEWNQICGELGMDTMTTGGTLAWAMEATEKGLFKSELKFGQPAGISELLADIAYRRGLGAELALGSRALADKYGGKDFAMNVKGLELAAYDPRATFGMGLNYAVANRGGCHLSSTIMVQESKLALLNPWLTRGKAAHVRHLENLYCAVNSMDTCHFTSYAYQLEAPMVRHSPRKALYFLLQYLPELSLPLSDLSMWPKLWSAITGVKLSQKDFMKAGERIHLLERYMNTREGISRKDDTLPARLLNEARGCDTEEKRTVPLDKMLDEYYRLRGYDSNGIPTDAALKRLGIEKR